MGEARRKKLLYGAPTKIPKKTRLDREIDKLKVRAQEAWGRAVRESGDSISWEDVPSEEKEFLYVVALGTSGALSAVTLARELLSNSWPPGTLMQILRADPPASWT